MEILNIPVLGGPAPRHAWRTTRKLATFALRWAEPIHRNSVHQRYLDVGCGNGSVTELVAPGFEEVVGIDVEETRLEDFRMHAGNKSNLKIFSMSAARIEFPDRFFSFITSFEVLEHVPNFDASTSEMVRVCRPGGIIVVSVPHVGFPFENHGARIGKWIYHGKIPILPYIRPLHRKCSLARVFSSAEMDRVFISKGMELLETSYAAPQFERAASRADSWESKLVSLRDLLDRCEKLPILRALTGVSMLKAYRKPALEGVLRVPPLFESPSY